MKFVLCVASIIVSFFAANACALESTWEYSVQVSASVETSPPRIILTWPQDTVAVPASYIVYRKGLGAGAWGTGTTLPGTTTTYADANVTVGATYEYQVVK